MSHPEAGRNPFVNFRPSAIAASSLVVAGLLSFATSQLWAPAQRERAPVERMSASRCRPLFDVVVSDAIPNIETDERDACGEHFASWVKGVPETAYRVDAGFLEVRGGRFALNGAKVWLTNYAVGNESLPSVLVVMDATAATLRFQSPSGASKALAELVAAGASRQ